MHADHVMRHFTADRVKVKRLFDKAEHWILEDRIEPYAIKDRTSRGIVGCAIHCPTNECTGRIDEPSRIGRGHGTYVVPQIQLVMTSVNNDWALQVRYIRTFKTRSRQLAALLHE